MYKINIKKEGVRYKTKLSNKELSHIRDVLCTNEEYTLVLKGDPRLSISITMDRDFFYPLEKRLPTKLNSLISDKKLYYFIQ